MSDGLAPMFRMPVSFGPAPGPRNLPEAHRHRRYEKNALTLTLSAATDPDLLAALLPQGFAVHGQPRIEVSLIVLSKIGWLAGRGYNIVMVRIPARWGGQEAVSGHFVPVLWESLADPILTGRDELGWPKIFADIPATVQEGGRWSASASWEGFTFLDIAASNFVAGADPAPASPMMFHKYVPRTGEWGEAEIDYFTVTAPDGPRPVVKSASRGGGRFEFHRARWEDMPTQYPIVNALAALPLREFGPATLVETTGGGDVSGQRRLT
uniref:acetoacetate decarboxylase family protein n=1 Tax=Altererythrobacter segetis TaxID=1104773 RepID=UPI001408AF73|nr:acetoacetate decarboxylase family protein [Altererythrobacter segetis]